ncbi:MAG: DUF1566 domain-containing protein [Proteobacteria bacterium]|nr:DUF1566 domain-containing protein [Pseudomonadota bacterium]
MRKYFGFFVFMLLLFQGCMLSTVEDASVYQPAEGFKDYVNPDIYIDDALISGSGTSTPDAAPEKDSNQTENIQSRSSGGLKKNKKALEWVVGPDRDTTWDEARSWIQNLSVDGGGWRMPEMEELKTLYMEGDTFTLANSTGRWVWSVETRGSSAGLFSFRYGVDKWSNRSFSKNNRGFAVRRQRE